MSFPYLLKVLMSRLVELVLFGPNAVATIKIQLRQTAIIKRILVIQSLTTLLAMCFYLIPYFYYRICFSLHLHQA